MPDVDDAPAPPSARERTYRLLVDAAREQLREAGPMTVAAVAERARVSRATAYRYFANNEAVLLAATVPVDQPEGLPPRTNGDVDVVAFESLADRGAALVRSTADWAFDHEEELRAVLALTLAPESKQRGVSRKGITNRGGWIAELMNELPDSVPPAARERLAASLVPLFGADAVVWTGDVAELSREKALDVLAWMARALINSTIAEFEGAGKPRKARGRS